MASQSGRHQTENRYECNKFTQRNCRSLAGALYCCRIAPIVSAGWANMTLSLCQRTHTSQARTYRVSACTLLQIAPHVCASCNTHTHTHFTYLPAHANIRHCSVFNKRPSLFTMSHATARAPACLPCLRRGAIWAFGLSTRRQSRHSNFTPQMTALCASASAARRRQRRRARLTARRSSDRAPITSVQWK